MSGISKTKYGVNCVTVCQHDLKGGYHDFFELWGKFGEGNKLED